MADKPLLTKKFNDDIDLGRKLDEGGVLAILYISVRGNDQETVKTALENQIFTKMLKEDTISLLEVNMFDIIKEKEKKKGEKYFSGVAEVKLVADDFRGLIDTILRNAPSAIEIIEPAEVKLNSEQMHSIVADVTDFVHMYSQQIIAMFKDPERAYLYDRMLKGE